MPESLARRDSVSHELLEFLDVREPTLCGSRPDRRAIDAYVEDAAASGNQHDAADLRFERRQQLLGHPGRPQQPTTLGAVFDFDAGAVLILGTACVEDSQDTRGLPGQRLQSRVRAGLLYLKGGESC